MSYDPIVMDTPDIATVMRMHATMNRIFMEVMCLYFEINSSSPTSMTPGSSSGHGTVFDSFLRDLKISPIG